jgi:cell wall-associated protease
MNLNSIFLSMKFSKTTCLALLAAILIQSVGYAQKAVPTNSDYTKLVKKNAELTDIQLQRWSHLDVLKDTIPGMSVDKAYSTLLNNKKGGKVIVGVIDSGVDVEHEDLKQVIWRNPREIAGNNIDDDKNGYVDDVHGWNFLGESTNENLELVRILKNPDDGSDVYKRAKAAYEKKHSEALQGKQQVDFILNIRNTIAKHLGKDSFTEEEIENISSTDSEILQAKTIMLSIIKQAGPGFDEEIASYKEYIDSQINFNLNLDFDGRKAVGDNPNDINDRKYGNPNVVGPDPEDALHGTHVAGIIAQVRNNNLGGDGIAQGVEIMALRAVPNGDEYDKDIALAIRYATDNGAKVINGSFGKGFSPHSDWVWDAMKYAASKDVLIVHAAGNDGLDLDKPENPSFPTDTNNGKEVADNVITIGALNHYVDENLVAPFSNYGTERVDVFAPGMKIYATVPGNKYKYEQGTSMASPNAAGVAALIRSYYPSLTAKQVKEILMNSGTPVSFVVSLGAEEEKRSFTQSCKSGKIVNAYQALVMAEKLSKNSKSKSSKN